MTFRPDPKPSPKAKKTYRLKKKPQKRVEYMGVMMPVHTKVYMEHFKIEPGDYIQCECCPKKAVDIHHIKPRGMGGSKTKDLIENLQALCRECHYLYGDNKQHLDLLIEKHSAKLGDGIVELLNKN